MAKQKETKPKVVVILGPTASGKSELAVKLAKKFNGEIVSADSRQVYKGMNLGTGKVPRENKKGPYLYKGITHYLLDVISPQKNFTVVDYQKLAKKAIKKILRKGKLPIICGGTGFYIDALIDNFQFPSPPPSSQLRKKLEKLSTEKLFEKLKKLDPQRAKRIDCFNRRRLIRALEIVLISKKPVPPLKKERIYQVLKIGIKKPKKELKKLIEKRLMERIKLGMIEEVKKLHQQGVSWRRLFNFGLEYRWISLYLQKKISYQEMLENLKRASWQYARRQMIWFKKDKQICWIRSQKEAEKLIKNFLKK